MNSRYNLILQVGNLAALQFNQKVGSERWQGFRNQKNICLSNNAPKKIIWRETHSSYFNRFFVPKFLCYNQLKPGRSRLMLKLSIIEIITLFFITPVARSIFRPLAQTHISELEFKNGHISRFRFVFQVIQVISSAKFLSAEEIDLSFNPETKEQPQISKPSFWKRNRENIFLQMF